MQKDEQKALQILKHFRTDVETIVPKFNGEVIQFYGDGCLLIFNSALEAIQCSDRLQISLKNDPEVPVRIGVHQGDIVTEEGNIFGDNVNIAARIESMSIPGAILISGKVQSELTNQSSIELKPLGSYEFKNVEKPIEVYAYAAEGFPVPRLNEVSGKFKTQREEKSIAVLAFKGRGPASDEEYFNEGIAEEIIYGLSKLDNLNVAGRRSSFSFKDSSASIKEIADKLNVEHILEGTVRRKGDRIRIHVQLVNVNNGFQIWTERFDRELVDIFSIQDEIADQVVHKLRLSLLGNEKGQSIIKRKTDNVKAYDLYLQGRSLLDKRKDIERALSCFKRAVEIDPNFAGAYTSLSYAYFYMLVLENHSPDDAWPKALSAIEKALNLDDTIAEAYTMRGLVEFYFRRSPENAREEYKKALLLQPNLADTYRVKSYFHSMLNEDDQAIQHAKRCLELDPIGFNNSFSLGDIYYRTKRYEDALFVFDELAEKYSDMINVQIMQSVIHFLLDDSKKAKMNLDLIDPDSIPLNLYGIDRFVIAAKLGERELAEKYLNKLLGLESKAWVAPTLIAVLYFALGDNENGIIQLQKGIDENDPALAIFPVIPLWEEYLEIPEVKALMNFRKE